MAVSTGKISRTDPLRDFKFRVQIVPHGSKLAGLASGLDKIGFAVVSGIAVQNEMIPYREGGMNTHPHKMVGMSDFTPVTFSRGVFATQDQLWRWQSFLHAWSQGTSTDGTAAGSEGDIDDYRCDITVQVLDHPYTAPTSYQTDPSLDFTGLPGNERLQFKLFNCWPGGFALSDLNAGASSIMVQQLTIHHEGFEIEFIPPAASTPIVTV